MLRKLALFLFLAIPALAWGDTLQLNCIPSANCTAGAETQITHNPSPVFSLDALKGSINGDELYLAIAVPTGGGIPSIAGAKLDTTLNGYKAGDLGTKLKENDLSLLFKAFVTASGQVGVDPSSYTVYEFSLGEAKHKDFKPINVSGLVNGDVLVAWAEGENAPGKGDEVVGQTFLAPIGVEDKRKDVLTSLVYGSSGIPTPTPESGTLLLFGSGLLALGKAIKQRL